LETFDTLPSLDGNIYLVPIDIMCRAIYLISTSVTQRDNTYYPFGQEAVSFQHIFDIAARELKFKSPAFVKRSDFDLKQLTPVKRALLLNNIFYINTEVKFIFINTYKILSQYNFLFPIVNENLLKKMIRYATSAKFLKNGEKLY
jgi:hypothetical protein